MEIPYQLIRSNRRTIAIQIKPNGEVVVRCPKRMRSEDASAYVKSKMGWLQKHLAQISSQDFVSLSHHEIEMLREQTRKLVTDRVKRYAPIMGVTYNQIAVRVQRTRWGSCSSKGNLNFNCMLCLVPPDVLDYIVVHELCHRKELNHSERFWKEVERVLPDYKQRQKWLKDHGTELIARLPM